MRAIPRFLAPSILKSSQRGKFAPEPLKLVEKLRRWLFPIGGGAYGVKTINSHSRKGVAQVSVSDALQLMLMFGTFIVTLLALVVELIKNQQKK